MSTVSLAFCAAGGNRHPSAADWAPGLLAFGAGHNIALWNPEDSNAIGIFALLAGHKGAVNAVKIYDGPTDRRIITGASDDSIRIWRQAETNGPFTEIHCLAEHTASVNVLSVLPGAELFVSGSADGTLRIWDTARDEARLVQTIPLKPRYLPLTCALIELNDDGVVLAAAGTSTSVQLYFRGKGAQTFDLQATLTGHEGWIRSLDFIRDRNGDILLSSACQDKFIRLWRIQSKPTTASIGLDPAAAVVSPIVSLSNKAHQVGSAGHKHNVTFEALLVGHEDWIYTARWAPPNSGNGTPTLLSASADNSLSVWRLDEGSNIWVCQTRLGEISAQKGSTTATGSTGGFWIGLWQPDGEGVISLGRTGSWRRWVYGKEDDSWLQRIGISGHTQEVQGCTWAPDRSYILSTGSDQTTRMFAQWTRGGVSSWHELARPQIHGYDLTCVASTTPDQFVSGADEKLLRVFNKPKAIDQLLSKLSGAPDSVNDSLPEGADIPVLGLSNKAVAADADDEDEEAGAVENGNGEQEPGLPATNRKSLIADLEHPPFEEHLARHTLWPEYEKLYGHGYEISAVAASHDGTLIATACKASSVDHAVIRLYDCREWREVKPSPTSHSLTVTSLSFSPDDKYLLSVSRDRGWYVFQRDASDTNKYTTLSSNPKGHSRMILDCCWAPNEAGSAFATASRDKSVKLWRLAEEKTELIRPVSVDVAVTAVAFTGFALQNVAYLAYGAEDGRIVVLQLNISDLRLLSTTNIERSISPSGAINALRWRPSRQAPAGSNGDGASSNGDNNAGALQLAAASDDTSLRIYDLLPT